MGGAADGKDFEGGPGEEAGEEVLHGLLVDDDDRALGVVAG